MSQSNPMKNQNFWNMLLYIDSMKRAELIEEMKSNYEQEFKESWSDKIFQDVISFLQKLSYPVKLVELSSGPGLDFTEEKIEFKLSMNMPEWLSLQAHFPLINGYCEEPFHESLADVLSELEAKYPKQDLFKMMERENQKSQALKALTERGPSPVKAVERALEEDGLVLFSFSDGKNIEVYPHCVVILDGVLSIIGEEAINRCLISFSIDEVIDCDLRLQHEYKKNFTSVEIDDFIYAMRAVGGNEERLILKVSAPENVDLRPAYHFLGNPYITTNMNGELIWAASVEISDELFKWLAEMKEDVEVLDPEDIRNSFEEYLEKNHSKVINLNEKQRNKLKKAS